jgi:hypothetical protein
MEVSPSFRQASRRAISYLQFGRWASFERILEMEADRMLKLIGLVLAAVVFVALAPEASQAQISNKPFSFKTPGGIGMSNAGRQAIINQKINGAEPEVLLRDVNGNLLGLEKGPDGLAIVIGPDGQALPGYRGRGWKGSNPALDVRVFNSYFVPKWREHGPPIPNASTSGEAVDAWTEAVIYGAPSGIGGSLDQWIAMANYLGPRLR